MLGLEVVAEAVGNRLHHGEALGVGPVLRRVAAAADEWHADVEAGVFRRLLDRRAAGEENPLLAIDVDLNGDGITDAFGLDENDEPVVVLGAALEDTSYESEGDDIAQFAPVDLGEPLFVDEED